MAERTSRAWDFASSPRRSRCLPLALAALRKPPEDRASTLDTVADLDLRCCFRRHQDVYPGTEFDQAHTLSALHAIANFQVVDDTTRQQTGNLLEADGVFAGIDGDESLFVVNRGFGLHGIHELALIVL